MVRFSWYHSAHFQIRQFPVDHSKLDQRVSTHYAILNYNLDHSNLLSIAGEIAGSVYFDGITELHLPLAPQPLHLFLSFLCKPDPFGPLLDA